jgi:hypothetical protein
MSEVQSRIAQRVHERGAAYVARELGVPRGTLLSFLAGTSREAQRELIEQRAVRLEGEPGQSVPR